MALTMLCSLLRFCTCEQPFLTTQAITEEEHTAVMCRHSASYSESAGPGLTHCPCNCCAHPGNAAALATAPDSGHRRATAQLRVPWVPPVGRSCSRGHPRHRAECRPWQPTILAGAHWPHKRDAPPNTLLCRYRIPSHMSTVPCSIANYLTLHMLLDVLLHVCLPYPPYSMRFCSFAKSAVPATGELSCKGQP